MEISYSYINSTDYIDRLSFDYIETYSLLRGAVYETEFTRMNEERDRLKVRRTNKENWTNTDEINFLKIDGLIGYTQYLINEQGEFHPSSRKINTFPVGHPIVRELTSILRTKIEDVPAWLCAPMYRDAIVFYANANKIVSTLNICLGCQYMATRPFSLVNGDYKTYKMLKELFISVGHDVEDD